MAVQLYVATKSFELPPVAEEDEMLDFQDIGGIYNDSSASAANNNRSVLQSFLTTESTSPGISLMFSGNRNPAYNDKRTPQPVYFDVSSTIANSVTNAAHVAFHGLTGTRLIGLNSSSATTPLFTLTRVASTDQQIVLSNLIIENRTGSGVKLAGTAANQGPGQGVVISGVQMRDIGNDLTVPHPSISYDDWTDLDAVPYALYVDKADGCMVSDFRIDRCNGHGIITTRWHEGICHAGIRECQGSGFKGEQVHGTAMTLRSESNKGWAMHIRDSGNNTYDTAVGGNNLRSSDGGPNAWEVWFEANNARESTSQAYLSSSGHAWRQCRFDGSSRITMGGNSGWKQNKIHATESSRRSCRFVESDYIDPSAGDGNAILLWDMNNDGVAPINGTTNDNWSTAWPDVSYRPSMVTTGDTGSGTLEAQITIPAECYDNATQTGWWKLQTADSTTEDGDMILWEAEISCDGNLVAYCQDREAIVGPNRLPAWLGNFSVWGPDVGTNFALWNQSRRKLSGRVHMETNRTIRMQHASFFAGMENTGASGITYPETEGLLRIHSMKVYRIKNV